MVAWQFIRRQDPGVWITWVMFSETIRWHAMLLVDNLKRFIKRNQVEIGAQFPEGFRYWRAHLLEPIPKTTSTSIDRIPMTLPFLVPEGYGFSNIDQELFTPKTNLSGGQLIAVNAFTNYQVLPVITITINSVTPNTPITLNISNATLYSHLEINTPLSAGDVLVLDSFDERATLNGNVVDAPGLFPFFTEPSEELSIQTDAASINFDINSTYRSLWL